MLRDLRSKNCLQTYTGHEKEITCVRFSPDGRWVASSSKDGQLHIWDIVAGKNLQQFRITPAYVTTFEFNPVDFMMMGATSTRNVKLWDLESMKPLNSYIPPDSSQIGAICYGYNDNTICTASKDNLKIWNWDPTVKLVGCCDIGWDRVCDIKVNANNELIAGSFISNFVSIYSINLDDVPPPMKAESKPLPPSTNTSSNNSNSSNINGKTGVSKLLDAKKDQNSNLAQALSIRGITSQSNVVNNNPSVFSSPPLSVKSKSSLVVSPISSTKHISYNKESQNKEIEDDSLYPLDPNKYDRFNDDKSDNYDSAVEITSSNSPPQLKWESEHAAKDMATSMGESFWKKFQESHQNNRQSQLPSSLAVKRSDSVDREMKVNESPSSISALSKLLPPSKYSSYDSETQVDIPLQAQKNSNVSKVNSKISSSDVSYESIHNEYNIPASNPNHMRSNVNVNSNSQSNSNNNKVVDVNAPSSAKVSRNNDPSDIDIISKHIDNLTASSTMFTNIITQRLTNLRILKRSWERNDIDHIIEYMMTLCESINLNNDSINHTAANMSTINPLIQQILDFFVNINFSNVYGVTFDHVIKLVSVLNMSLFISPVNSKHDYSSNKSVVLQEYTRESQHLIIILTKVLQLYDIFREMIQNLKSSNIYTGYGNGGVDLVREERLKRYQNYESCIASIRKKVSSYEMKCRTYNIAEVTCVRSNSNINGLDDLIMRFHAI